MRNIIKNMHKASGIFICRHPGHSKFDNRVSPYHVLRDKQCYQKGCVEFKWHCDIALKGKKCPRKYNFVGRNCSSCKYYREEKICRIPETLIDDQAMKRFLRDLDEYEFWLSNVTNKRVQFSGEIDTVFPHLRKEIDHKTAKMFLNGFLISFANGYIDDDLFDDRIYLRIGRTFLERFQPSTGDTLDFNSELQVDRGRLVLSKPRSLDITKSGDLPAIDYSKALVGKASGAIVTDDISLCHNCQYGAHLDIEQLRPRQEKYRRF